MSDRLISRARPNLPTEEIEDVPVDRSRKQLLDCPSGHVDRLKALTDLATRLYLRYDQFGKTDDLNETIDLFKEIRSLHPPEHPDRSNSLFTLALQLSRRYSQLWRIHDLDDAIVFGREALSLRPDRNPDCSASLNNLAFDLFLRYEALWGMNDLREAIGFDRRSLELHPPEHAGRLTPLRNLTWHLWSRYKHLGGVGDLTEAIDFGQEALLLSPDHPAISNHLAICHSFRYKQLGRDDDIDKALHLARVVRLLYLPTDHNCPWSLSNLANVHFIRFERLGDIEDLQSATNFDQTSLSLCSSEHRHRPVSLHCLANRLFARFKQLGDIDDLQEAVRCSREALSLLPAAHPNRSAFLTNLASRLISQYEHQEDIQYLDEAIVLDQEALTLCPPGHPSRSVTLNNLANHLSSRYNRQEDIGDLNQALVYYEEALSLHPLGHTHRLASLNNLASHLFTRYDSQENLGDLNEALDLYREALSTCPPEHGDRRVFLINLAVCLSSRYDRLRGDYDLDEAADVGENSLSHCPPGHYARPWSLNIFATLLSYRYDRSGDNDDLNEVIVVDREALSLCPPGRLGDARSLMGLALNLFSRYRQLGVIDDLNAAISFDEEVLSLRPSGHPDRSVSLINLANHLSFRYKEREDIRDLDRAIKLGRESLSLCPVGDAGRSQSLISLAAHLLLRYERLGSTRTNDLNTALQHNQEALSLCPAGHSDRPSCLSNCARCFFTLFKQLRKIEDLNAAIDLGQQILQIFPVGHPARSAPLGDLAQFYYTRFKTQNDAADKDEVFRLYTELQQVSQTVSSDDLSIAKDWVNTAESESHAPATIPAYETALRFLVEHSAALPSLPQHLNLIKSLSSSLAVDAFSACLRDQNTTKAVELLEQGRGVFWRQLSRLRSSLDDVVASGTEGKRLADEFKRLASLIHKALSDSSVPDQHNQVCALNVDLTNVVSSIRELPNLSRFLLPSSFTDLQLAAISGPVIIVNASKYGCDALIVFFNMDPVHVLLSVTKEEVQELSSRLRALRISRVVVKKLYKKFLRDLWDIVVSDIVDALHKLGCPHHSRIWWCPTADFSHLPLHAAAPYRNGRQGVPNLFISSYTTTLTALIHARRPERPQITKRFAAIGQADSPGFHKLKGISKELTKVSKSVENITMFTRVEGSDADIPRVTDELSKNEWVHFACHGVAKQKEPFKSGFGLRDGMFTIQQILQCDMQNPEFAYLSACQTSVGDEERPDEVIHLASAMQFAGFRSVIGTMWYVGDLEAVVVASKFYKFMVTERGGLDSIYAAWALWATLKTAKIPLDQRILYVHHGA